MAMRSAASMEFHSSTITGHHVVFHWSLLNVLAGSNSCAAIGRCSYREWLMHNYPIEIHNSDARDCVTIARMGHSYFGLEKQEDPIHRYIDNSWHKHLSEADQMKKCWLFYTLGLVVTFSLVTNAAKGGGGGRGSRGRLRGRIYGSAIPVLIPHRNPASAHYYENKDGAKIIKASHFELDYMLGRKITFFCMARGYPRPEITWFKDGIELYHHKFFQVHEWPLGNDTMKSKMEIDPATQKDAGYYECQADNQYSVDRRGFRTDYVMITY